MASKTSQDWRELLSKVTKSNRQEDLAFVACLEAYIESGDIEHIARVVAPPLALEVEQIGSAVGAIFPWGVEEERVAEFAGGLFCAHPSRRYPNFHALIDGLMREVQSRESEGQVAEGEKLLNALGKQAIAIDDLLSLVSWTSYCSAFSGWARGWERPGGRPPRRPTTFEKTILGLDADVLVDGVESDDGHTQYLLCAVAKERPEIARRWFDELVAAQALGQVPSLRLCALVRAVGDFDRDAFCYLKECREPAWVAEVALALLERLTLADHPELLAAVMLPEIAAAPAVHDFLVSNSVPGSLALLNVILREKLFLRHSYVGPERYVSGYSEAARQWSRGGREVFQSVATDTEIHTKKIALEQLLRHAADTDAEEAAGLARSMVENGTETDQREPLLALMGELRPVWFVDDWWCLLGDTSKQIRTHAATALADVLGSSAVSRAVTDLSARRSEARLGAVLLLSRIGGAEAVQALRAVAAEEKSKAVKAEIENALVKLGEPTVGIQSAETIMTIADLEASLAVGKRRTGTRVAWLDIATFPMLHTVAGQGVPPLVLEYLVSGQVMHKASAVAPGVSSLLAQIDRARSGDFALALLEAWLASPQDAKDRWALALAGALGDTRILSVLNSWIQKWCEKGRGKLAEYAAQAIALQGSDEALMLLDALATRYRSKQRNIGAAAAAAFQAAAEARGLSPDELGDVVVPAFGFDADGVRDFAWEGGAARAELGVDLKIAWSDPEKDKALKGLPASAPDALKSEAKELGKLLREAAKGQAARFELALVRQRRWPVARWRELYENHPVLRAYATRLVWGVYRKGEADAETEALLRCFRRYPNGLLADAAGGLEELPEADALIGMVHPLELSAEAISEWHAHLGRFKVTPPFPQLDRPVERLDPLHANRRELAVATDRALGAGTFRSRAERRGWVRGSVVDAGMVAGYFKAFPGAGVEVTLEIEGLYVGIDPMDTVTLGVARFVRADSVKRGSYTYDDPQAGDARVLPFGDVPPVVYSEAVGDLKAIAGMATAAADAEGDEA